MAAFPSVRHSLSYAFLVVLGSLMLYAPSIPGSFVYDDFWTIVKNPSLKSGRMVRWWTDPSSVAAPESGLADDIYRPLTTTSLGLDWRLWKDFAPAYRAENVLLHALITFLFFLILRRWLGQEDIALIGALVFAFHPANVQVVAWPTQRSTLLSAFGCLLAWWFLQRPVSKEKALAAYIAYAGALFSKETAVVFPVLFFLAEGIFSIRSWKEIFLERRAVLVALGGLATAFMLFRFGMLGHLSQIPEAPRDVILDAATGLKAFSFYVGKTLVPVNLRASYAYPEFHGRDLYGSAIFALVFGVALYGLFRRGPRWIACCLGWFMVALLPVLQIVPIRAFFADRFLYVPLMGVGALVAGIAQKRPQWRVFLWGVIFLEAFGVLRLLPAWRNETALWQNTVRCEPTNAFARACLADTLKDNSLAVEEYRRVWVNRSTPILQTAVAINLGQRYYLLGDLRLSAYWSNLALQREPDNLHALANLYRVARQTKDKKTQEKIQHRLESLGWPKNAFQNF